MTKVDFYIIPGQTIQQRLLFTCRLVEKAYKLKHTVYIHTNESAQAEQLNKLLWSFRSSSFIPHRLHSDKNRDSQPVTIGYGDCSLNHTSDLMINLSDKVPDFFSRFERVSEIVVQDSTITETTRKNYRFYRDRGYPLQSHDLRH